MKKSEALAKLKVLIEKENEEMDDPWYIGKRGSPEGDWMEASESGYIAACGDAYELIESITEVD